MPRLHHPQNSMVENSVPCYLTFQISAHNILRDWSKDILSNFITIPKDVMCELPVASTVGDRDHTKNQFNVGIVSDRKGRSYAITTESNQKISCNRIDLKKTNVQYT